MQCFTSMILWFGVSIVVMIDSMLQNGIFVVSVCGAYN
jgi:hypothetical protein